MTGCKWVTLSMSYNTRIDTQNSYSENVLFGKTEYQPLIDSMNW